MKKVTMLHFVFLLIVFLVPWREIHADCKVASFNDTTRTLNTCVGGFNSKDDLKNTTVVPTCSANSNGSIVCRDVNAPPQFTLGSLPSIESNIRQDTSGKYYTCVDIQGVNRAIGWLTVEFKGNNYCKTEMYKTVPPDWNTFTEGMPWQQGTNDPRSPAARNIFCADNKSVQTAIGCISTDPAGFITKFLGFGVGIAGGIAFLLILFGGFQIITSAGNPEQMNAGKELISSAIAGLLLIIFSILLLKIIGYNILGIPDFS